MMLWSHGDGEVISEIGWMVLPEFHGRGIAKMAVRALLQLACDADRWGLVHAFLATTNGICRSRRLQAGRPERRQVCRPCNSHEPLGHQSSHQPDLSAANSQVPFRCAA
jgi:hypothetical protein